MSENKNIKRPALLVLAAGMGSRYGGLKQLDPLGPHGETIMDYSVYDALKTGFGRVVFVIRHDFDRQFRERVLARYDQKADVDVVYQSMDALPEGYKAPEGRTRPWGTAHAILMAAQNITEPFAVINADDFYGRDAFAVVASHLSQNTGRDAYCMAGFKVGNTMTQNGSVSRGVCTVDGYRRLRRIVERRKIFYNDKGDIVCELDGATYQLDPAVPVSMNLWGFPPEFFEHGQNEFIRFLDKYGHEADREFFIPSVVDKLISNGLAKVSVLATDSQWFGVTYAEDRQNVVDNLKALHEGGAYPEKLF